MDEGLTVADAPLDPPPEDLSAMTEADLAEIDRRYYGNGARQPGEDDGPSKVVPLKPKRLNLAPVSSLLAETIPETQWLIAPYLEAGTLACLVAPPNIGKTLLAFYFAQQIASAGKRVAIVEEEGGRRGFQKRLSRALYGCPSEVLALISVTYKPRLSLMSPTDVNAMCAELAGYDLVIIDSLARVTPGLEENDAQGMGLIVARMETIGVASGACVFSLHHSGKAKWAPGEIPSLSDGRGSSALAAGLDTVLALAPLSKSDQTTGHVSFDLHVTKQRDEDNQITPRRVRVSMLGDHASVEMEDVGAVEKSTTRGRKPLRSYDDLKTAIINAVLKAKLPPSKSSIKMEVGGDAGTAFAAINELIEDGVLRLNDRGRLLHNGNR